MRIYILVLPFWRSTRTAYMAGSSPESTLHVVVSRPEQGIVESLLTLAGNSESILFTWRRHWNLQSLLLGGNVIPRVK